MAVIKGVNDLKTKYPELLSEWHPTKNLPLTPDSIVPSSKKEVWWKCSVGHEWQARVGNRTYNKATCPYCSGKRILKGYNDFATLHPLPAAEWHPNKNGDSTPDMFPSTAEVKMWWLGKCGHEWEASIFSRSNGNGCPICRGLLVVPGINDLRTINPALASEWHPTKNGDLLPSMVTHMSEKKVWWKCAYGHEWLSTIANRSHGVGCAKCSNRLHTSFPEQAVYYYVKKFFPNAVSGYRDIFSKTMELDVYVPEIKCGIEYDGVAWHIGKNKYASDREKYRICKENDITLIRIKEKRDEILDYSDCDICIETKVNPQGVVLDLAIKKALDVLIPNNNIIVNTDDHANEIRNSFLSVLKSNSLKMKNPELASQWHPTLNGNLTPDMFYASSNVRVWWLCKENHSWQAKINDRNRGFGCPYCSNQKALAGYNDLGTTNPSLALEWDMEKNSPLTPQMILAGTEKKYWWKCSKGHEWQAAVYLRNKGKRNCPICNKTSVITKDKGTSR